MSRTYIKKVCQAWLTSTEKANSHFSSFHLLSMRNIGLKIANNNVFRFFMGSTVSDVIKQYWNVIGTPGVPPYWGLGHFYGRLIKADKAIKYSTNLL